MGDDTPRFCTACGRPLAEGNAFCTACGARAQAPPATPTPPVPPAPPVASAFQPAPVTQSAQAAAPPERTLAVIGNLTQLGGFMGMKAKTYSLIITDWRVIFAELTKERITAMVNQARDEAKADGKGFFGQWGAQLGTSFNYHEVYWQMLPDAALAETPGNFAIDRREIRSVKFKAGMADDDGHSSPDQLIIKTTSGKHTLQVNGSLGAVRDAFRNAGIA
jgi:hypothetical protein